MTQQSRTTEARRAILENAALTAGEQWALSYRDEMRGQGRPIAGGWPGTLSEARARVAACLRLQERHGSTVTSAELTWLAKTAYARARRQWLAVAERDGP
jgi:hypothetical protein